MMETARYAASDGFAVDSPATEPQRRTVRVLLAGMALVAALPLALAIGTSGATRHAAEAWRGPIDLLEPEMALVPEAVEKVTRVSLAAAGELYALFVERGYQLDEAKRGADAVPRMVVERLPRDLASLESTDLRKAVFIKSLLPLLLLENERILADRARLERIFADRAQGTMPSIADSVFLDEIAERYDVDTDRVRDTLRKVDAVPVSLALAQAALETGWGTSRPAQAGHALFGQMVYRDAADDDGRVRRFDDLPGAVAAYALNLNTHRAYAEFRRARERAAAEGKPADGHALAQHLQRYSERRMDYVRDVRSVMRANGLRALDRARLDAEPG
ncbi:MAG: glucosaminidase domain-containing protein [Rhodospirillales bacterium]|nr:glucosaminidase domain-containing protein [Rhodospirillales bacterium]